MTQIIEKGLWAPVVRHKQHSFINYWFLRNSKKMSKAAYCSFWHLESTAEIPKNVTFRKVFVATVEDE